MHHDELRIDEYLRGELGADEAERVADLLETSEGAREHADWLMRLEGLVEEVRIEPPAEVVAALEARLLALPGGLTDARAATDGRTERRSPRRGLPGWLAYPAPLLRAAAMLLAGLAVGYGIWGRQAPGEGSVLRPSDARMAAEPAAAGEGIVPASQYAREAAGAQAPLAELEARVTALERNLQAAYLARVEAAMLRFVTDTAEGSPSTLAREDTRDLLMLTANLKAEHKSADDMRMARVLGQIESVLMEIQRLTEERDLAGARHVASLIEEQGLLTTIQRLKVGVED